MLVKEIAGNPKRLSGDKTQEVKGIYNILGNKAVIPLRRNEYTLLRWSFAKVRPSDNSSDLRGDKWKKSHFTRSKNSAICIYIINIK